MLLLSLRIHAGGNSKSTENCSQNISSKVFSLIVEEKLLAFAHDVKISFRSAILGI
jgi:hypothetical protein